MDFGIRFGGYAVSQTNNCPKIKNIEESTIFKAS